MGVPAQLQALDQRGAGYATIAADCLIHATTVNLTTTDRLPVPAAPMPGRRRIYLKNPSDAVAYIGGDDVTTTNGYPLNQHDMVALDIISRVTPYAVIPALAQVELMILEIA